ncbi:arsenate reductase/protein-tyrosine-phosphatase family protein [Blastococcus sp. SYSU D01042]
MLRSAPGSAFTVLVVCTGNICRSALAERLGRAYLDERLGSSTADLQLVSAGTRAVSGSGMHPDSALVLAGYGAAPGEFRARQIDGRIASSADLVLTMTRAHRTEVLQLAPAGLQRSFTLVEAATILDEIAGELQGADFPERARALVHAMAAARGRRVSSRDDDVQDPIRRSIEVHEQVGELIAATLIPILDRLVGLLPAALADRTPSLPVV